MSNNYGFGDGYHRQQNPQSSQQSFPTSSAATGAYYGMPTSAAPVRGYANPDYQYGRLPQQNASNNSAEYNWGLYSAGNASKGTPTTGAESLRNLNVSEQRSNSVGSRPAAHGGYGSSSLADLAYASTSNYGNTEDIGGQTTNYSSADPYGGSLLNSGLSLAQSRNIQGLARDETAAPLRGSQGYGHDRSSSAGATSRTLQAPAMPTQRAPEQGPRANAGTGLNLTTPSSAYPQALINSYPGLSASAPAPSNTLPRNVPPRTYSPSSSHSYAQPRAPTNISPEQRNRTQMSHSPVHPVARDAGVSNPSAGYHNLFPPQQQQPVQRPNSHNDGTPHQHSRPSSTASTRMPANTSYGMRDSQSSSQHDTNRQTNLYLPTPAAKPTSTGSAQTQRYTPTSHEYRHPLPVPQQSTSPKRPTTVDPAHVYNQYHEYQKQIEAAEAEAAQLAKAQEAQKATEAAEAEAARLARAEEAQKAWEAAKAEEAKAARLAQLKEAEEAERVAQASRAAEAARVAEEARAAEQQRLMALREEQQAERAAVAGAAKTLTEAMRVDNRDGRRKGKQVEEQVGGWGHDHGKQSAYTGTPDNVPSNPAGAGPSNVISNDQLSHAAASQAQAPAPGTPGSIEEEMRLAVEKVREYQSRDPKLFLQVWSSARKDGSAGKSAQPQTERPRAQGSPSTPTPGPALQRSPLSTSRAQASQRSPAPAAIPAARAEARPGSHSRVPRTEAPQRGPVQAAVPTINSPSAQGTEGRAAIPAATTSPTPLPTSEVGKHPGSGGRKSISPEARNALRQAYDLSRSKAGIAQGAAARAGEAASPGAQTSSPFASQPPSSAAGAQTAPAPADVAAASQIPRTAAQNNAPASRPAASQRSQQATPVRDEPSQRAWTAEQRDRFTSTTASVLNNIPENVGKTIQPQEIRIMLESNPTYYELCQKYEDLGFKFDRARLAKTLFAVMPKDPRKNQPVEAPRPEPTSTNLFEAIPESAQRSQDRGMASAAAQPMPQSAPPVDHRHHQNAASHGPEAGPLNNEEMHQMSLLQAFNKTFQPSNGASGSAGAHAGGYSSPYQHPAAVHGSEWHIPLPHQPQPNAQQQNQPNVANNPAAAHGNEWHIPLPPPPQPNAQQQNRNWQWSQLPAGAQLPPAARNFMNLSAHNFGTPGGRAVSAASPAQQSPKTLSKAEAARKRTFAEIIDLTTEGADKGGAAPETMDEQRKRNRVGDGIINFPAPAAPAPHGPPFQPPQNIISLDQQTAEHQQHPQQQVGTPLATATPNTLNRHNPLTLYNDIVQPFNESLALKRTRYNPKTIARDILVSTGRHPTQRGLNAHLEQLKVRFSKLDNSADLSTFRWDLVDPGGAAVGSANIQPPDSGGAAAGPASTQPDPMATSSPKASPRGQVWPSANRSIPGTPRESAPARPSGLRNETPQESNIAVVLPLASPSELLSKATPSKPAPKHDGPKPKDASHQADGKAGHVVNRRVRKSAGAHRPDLRMPIPKYHPFLCEWKGCKAELQNLETLRKHVFSVHGKVGEDERIACLWAKCGDNVIVLDDDGTSDKTFRGLEAWKKHVERDHLVPFAWHMGDGPSGSSVDGNESERSSYLHDASGYQVTPSIAAQAVESGSAALNNERRAAKRTARGQKEFSPWTYWCGPGAVLTPSVREGERPARSLGAEWRDPYAEVEREYGDEMRRATEQSRGLPAEKRVKVYSRDMPEEVRQKLGVVG